MVSIALFLSGCRQSHSIPQDAKETGEETQSFKLGLVRVSQKEKQVYQESLEEEQDHSFEILEEEEFDLDDG